MQNFDLAQLDRDTTEGVFSRLEVPRLLLTPVRRKLTGALKLVEGTAVRMIGFASGAPTVAASSLSEERLGALLLTRGVLDAAKLAQIDETMRSQGLQFGAAAMALGVLSKTELARWLREQHAWVVTRCILAETQRATFGPLGKLASARTGLPLLRCIEDGIRQYPPDVLESLPQALGPTRFTISPGEMELAQGLGCTPSLAQLLSQSSHAHVFDELIAFTDDDDPAIPVLTLILTRIAGVAGATPAEAPDTGEHPPRMAATDVTTGEVLNLSNASDAGEDAALSARVAEADNVLSTLGAPTPPAPASDPLAELASVRAPPVTLDTSSEAPSAKGWHDAPTSPSTDLPDLPPSPPPHAEPAPAPSRGGRRAEAQYVADETVPVPAVARSPRAAAPVGSHPVELVAAPASAPAPRQAPTEAAVELDTAAIRGPKPTPRPLDDFMPLSSGEGAKPLDPYAPDEAASLGARRPAMTAAPAPTSAVDIPRVISSGSGPHPIPGGIPVGRDGKPQLPPDSKWVVVARETLEALEEPSGASLPVRLGKGAGLLVLGAALAVVAVRFTPPRLLGRAGLLQAEVAVAETHPRTHVAEATPAPTTPTAEATPPPKAAEPPPAEAKPAEPPPAEAKPADPPPAAEKPVVADKTSEPSKHTKTKPAAEPKPAPEPKIAKADPKPPPKPSAEPKPPKSADAAAPKPGGENAAKLAEIRKLIGAGDYRQVVVMCTDILKVDPRNAQAYRSLGIAYSGLGAKPQACESYRRYLRLAGNPPDKAQIENILAACGG
jgi:outer membrane biosynthesis protein TonB